MKLKLYFLEVKFTDDEFLQCYFFFIFKYSFAGYRILGCCFLGGGWFSIESEFWTHFPLFFFLKGEESSHCIIHPICCRNCPQNHCQAGQLFHHSELPTSRVHYVLSVLWHRRQTKVPQETSRKDREPMLDRFQLFPFPGEVGNWVFYCIPHWAVEGNMASECSKTLLSPVPNLVLSPLSAQIEEIVLQAAPSQVWMLDTCFSLLISSPGRSWELGVFPWWCHFQKGEELR